MGGGELAHGLSRAERQLVTVISQDLPREKCCRVFIDPHTIERFARANPADADECNDLARRLFGAF